jgi:hypothetical protein
MDSRAFRDDPAWRGHLARESQPLEGGLDRLEQFDAVTIQSEDSRVGDRTFRDERGGFDYPSLDVWFDRVVEA